MTTSRADIGLAPPPPVLSVRGYIVVGAIFVLFGILAIVFFASAKRRDRLEQCRLNLFYLKMGSTGQASPQDPMLWDAMPTGSAFWLSYEKWPVIPTRPIRQETLLCPMYASVKGRTGCDYRGPAKSVRAMEPSDPLACDRLSNHGPDQPINIILMGGDLLTVRECDSLWTRAAVTTSE